jgi:Kdo2-lipid IVA lauroyltransferase/acyltransferase
MRMAFLRLLASPRWPLWLIHALGGTLGWLAYALSPTYRRRLRANAAQAGIAAAARRQSVAEAGKLVAELPRLWLRPRGRPIADPVHWDGLAHLESLVAAPEGLIVLTPHMGSFEMTAQAYVQRFGAAKPMTALYRPARQAWLAELERTARQREHLHTAPANLAGVRQLLRALKAGQCVGMLPDQVPPAGQGVWAPFFGAPAYTMTLAARLARQTGAALVLIVTERLPAGAGYAVRAQPLSVPLFDSGAASADGDLSDATAINASMEAVISRWPGQYLWGYHRYKAPREGADARPAAPAEAGA